MVSLARNLSVAVLGMRAVWALSHVRLRRWLSHWRCVPGIHSHLRLNAESLVEGQRMYLISNDSPRESLFLILCGQ